MAKKYSKKFWIMFWGLAILLLLGFYFFLQIEKNGINNLAENLPVSERYKAVAYFIDYLTKKDGVEKTFLILFQNNLEIRPGGGFIGAFGILKVKDGKIVSLETHDSGLFDERIAVSVEPPYPMRDFLRIKSWGLRDSNFSPDFPINAEKAEEFYALGQGWEKFDGVVGITTNVLISFLKVTGPVQLEGYPGSYGDENAILQLEYQVEKGFEEQGIPRTERKSIMNEIAKEIMRQVSELDNSKKIRLAEIIYEDLNRKDILLNFKDKQLQEKVEKSGWGGIVDQSWFKDYLMLVDANLGAYKSDYYVKRSVDYAVDLSFDRPVAKLKVTYEHTAEKKDFMTKDYLSYLRVYVPEGSWMENSQNLENPKFGNELGKKYFGGIVKVPLGETKTVEITYTLPERLRNFYNLKIQKQTGVNDIPFRVAISRGKEDQRREFLLNSDIVLSEME